MNDALKKIAGEYRREMETDPAAAIMVMILWTLMFGTLIIIALVFMFWTWPYGPWVLLGLVFGWKAFLNYGKGEDE